MVASITRIQSPLKHPYKTKGNIIFLYSLFVRDLGISRKDNSVTANEKKNLILTALISALS
jgi:hypothetical protein